ncbi:MAG: hypothetical protein WAX14_08300 [Rhodococcus sp. (in: high G+C Gram-positive bacteria)]|uniref:hypothetical protein n=1 Tax=Rhodococcus sp. TaxID=1831 RepID=UPI003BB4B778
MSALTDDRLQLRRHRSATPEEITARRRKAAALLGHSLPVTDEEKRRYREAGKLPPTA